MIGCGTDSAVLRENWEKAWNNSKENGEKINKSKEKFRERENIK